MIEEALQQALAAGDTAGAAHLVEGQFLPAFEQERVVQIERWLGLLPEEQIQGSPCLLAARMWILQAHGQLEDFPALLRAAELLLETSDSSARDLDDPQRRSLQAWIAILWSQFQYFTGQAQASLESARSALEWLPPGEEYVASFALTFLAWSNQAIGQEDVALLELNNALRERPAHLNGTARLLFAQAWVYLAAGKLHRVEQTARHLLQIAQQADMALSQNFAHWLLGVVYYEWNNLDAAAYHFSTVIANQHHAHFWVVQDAMHGLALAYQAQGLGTQAQETARTLLGWVQEQHTMGELMKAYASCGQLVLLQDEGESAEQWLDMGGKQEVAGPMTFLEDLAITRAWMLLAKGDEPSVAAGQALLAHLLQHVQTIHSTRKTISVLALQAWAYNVQGRKSEALTMLERALALGRPAGFIRTFADLLRLAPLLEELRKRGRAQPNGDEGLDGYLQRILAAMNPMAARAVSTKDLLRQEGLEALSRRELHILHLLDKELTNKEMAHELAITPDTVKRHTQQIYRKLNVNNRRAAVTVARALGMLASDKAPTPRLR